MLVYTETMKYNEELGEVPFHLGCNALAVHPNCILHDAAREAAYREQAVGARTRILARLAAKAGMR